VKSLKYSEILKGNRELKASLTGEQYQIILLSNIVVNQFKEVLEFVLRRQGINAEVVVGDYDNIVQDSSRFTAANAVIIFWEAANLVEGLHAFISQDGADVDALGDRVESEIALVLKNLQHVPLVLINSFSSLLFSADELRDGPLKLLCRRLNAALAERVAPNQLIVDLNAILAQVGLGSAADFRQFQSSKALYSISFFKAYATAVEPAFRAVTGRARKVLVLDCDNTLWAGILGEDGDTGIEIGEASLKGRVFLEVQRILGGFRRQGVLLALCSKNNPEDVDRVLATHPEIVLTEEDFVAKKVNWNNKVSNLLELAAELNLGLDSFVFVDDSAFEIEFIEKELPQIKCVRVPEVLSEYPGVMRDLSREFFSLSQTAEDAQKTEQYRKERQRKTTAVMFDTPEGYLASLGLKVNITWGRTVPLSRVSQMTQKTNQFNLTTRRYTEGDIRRMLDDPDFCVAVFSVEDRFGDYGVTGLVIVEKKQDEISTAFIDTLLMSCRVIGRNVEYSVFDHLADKLKQMGIINLHAEYIETPRNQQVSHFYDGLGFSVTSPCDTRRSYVINLNQYQPRNIPYIELTDKENLHG
jgi:FkbH-like protein